MSAATPDFDPTPDFPEMTPEEFSARLEAGQSVTLTFHPPYDDSGFDPKAWDEHWLNDDLSD